jgi:hypothetical protein
MVFGVWNYGLEIKWIMVKRRQRVKYKEATLYATGCLIL